MLRALQHYGRLALFLWSLGLVLVAWPRCVFADDTAPMLRRARLQAHAQSTLATLFAALPPDEQGRLSGLYLAVDSHRPEPLAQIACDDDGDYVVVLTEAMLVLVDELAHGDVLGGRSLEGVDERRAEIVAFVLARAVARFRHGEYACPNPTATREVGDAQWTADEAALAATLQRDLRVDGQAARDKSAAALVAASGFALTGAQCFLTWLAQSERHHPASSRVSIGAAVRRQALDARMAEMDPRSLLRRNFSDRRPSIHREAQPARSRLPSLSLPSRRAAGADSVRAPR